MKKKGKLKEKMQSGSIDIKPVNITDQELDRDIIKLNMPDDDLDIWIENSERPAPFYDDEMNEWLNSDFD